MRNSVNLGELLVLRSQCDELTQLLKNIPRANVLLPEVAPTPSSETEAVVEVGDALSATLSSINKATNTLSAKGIAFAGHPIEMQLSGEFIGLDNSTREVFVKIKPQGKTKGKRKYRD